jgi:CubicO group peptidase (beta-lactamase class C family)
MTAVRRLGAWLPLLALLGIAVSTPVQAALAGSRERYPAARWERVANPERAGWSLRKLEEARKLSESMGSAAVLIVHDGRVLQEWGETARRFRCHSMRKSLLSALYGIYAAEGKIRLTSTLEELGIDDADPPLSAAEKQARVIDLLRARSGVYHAAAAEIELMRAMRPERGSHKPGTFFCYNNWDFNALGTIFRKTTGLGIGEAFQKRIAEPLQMQDFRLQDVRDVKDSGSLHPSYPFRMSARDLGRFGLLYLRQGRWDDRQVIPSDWVTESTRAHSLLDPAGLFGVAFGGYGYMWWVAVDGKHLPGVDVGPDVFSAQGYGGHFLVVMPRRKLVVVHRMNTEAIGPDADLLGITRQFGSLLRLILEAQAG